jgi:thiol:disulfide interchange protein
MRLLLSLILLCTVSSSFGQTLAPGAGAPGSSDFGAPDLDNVQFLPVEEAYQLALEVIDENQVRVYWQIADTYYLYRKRFSFHFETAQGPIELTETMPDGLVREDEYFGVSEVYYHSADVVLRLDQAGADGVLHITSQGCADAGLCYPPQKQSFAINLENGTIAAVKAAARRTTALAPETAPGSAETTAEMSLLYMLLLAFIGGSILNLMPCVFPVLSLKVLSMATGDAHSRHRHGWVYGLGVVTSFLLVAAVLIGLQQAGAAVGWGFQLQSTIFVSLLAYLFFVMGLSLSGVLEFGTSVMGTGQNLASKGGYTGSFFTGVLATVVASPCTAPFMGTALGFAVTQPTPVALLVFAALGAGMAAPMVVLSHSKTLRSMMPKPGAWMETFKQVLAFPLYATAIWLLWVAGRQTGVNGMAVLLCGLLALALAALLWRYNRVGRTLAVALTLLAVGLVSSPLLAPQVQQDNIGNGESRPFSEASLNELRAGGKPVFINFTADWCITCIANERGALATDSVRDALRDKQVVYLKADWTNYDPVIAQFLKRFNRNGIPLYLVYSGPADNLPQVLPQLLTPGIILEALDAIQ